MTGKGHKSGCNCMFCKTRKFTKEHKRKISESRKGQKHTKETKQKLSEYYIEYYKTHSHPQKGKTFDEVYGKERSIHLKKQQSKRTKGKTYEEMYGKEKAEEIKQKHSHFLKQYYKNNPHPQTGKTPYNKGKTNRELFGEEKANELGRINSDIHKGQIPWNKGIPRTEETKRRIIKTIEKGILNGTIIAPYVTIRQNSPYIWKGVNFDSREEMKCARILLNKPISGVNCHIPIGIFEIDFYLEEINLFVEYHPFDLKRTHKTYLEQRKEIVRNSKYSDSDLIVTVSLKETEKINWIKEEC